MATPMTPAQLLAVLKAEGLTIKEYTGWDRRCRCCPDSGPHRPTGPWNLSGRGWGKVNGTVTHITAGDLGSRTVEQYIAAIINGDPAVPVKAQIVVAPDGTVYLNSAGRANHAGKVGSKVQAHLIAADYSTTDDYDDRFRGGSVDGNAFTYGIENIAASSMSAAQRAASVKINAAIARHYGWTGQESVGHGEISSARVKADPNLDMGKFRKDVMAAVKAGAKATPPVVTPPTDPPAPPVTTLNGAHWNIAGSDDNNGYGARNATRGPAVGRYIDSIGFEVFTACEAGQDNLRHGIDKALGTTAWEQRAKAIWFKPTVKNVKARKAYSANLFSYRNTMKWGAAFFGEKDGQLFSILEIHTDYRKPAKQAKQVQNIFTKWAKDCDAQHIKTTHRVVVGDFNWDGTSGDNPFTSLAAYGFEEKGDHKTATFMTGKHLDGVLAHKSADVEVTVHSRNDLSDHMPVLYKLGLK